MSRSRALVGLVAVVLASCTVPSEDRAQVMSADEVPFELTGVGTTTDVSVTSVTANRAVKVFLVRDDRLEVVDRIASPADPENVLALLALGPTETETASGMRSALVADLAEIVDTERDLITIDLADEFSALAPTEQRLALAQITYAMTQLPSLNRVEFLVAGQPASVPRGNGSSTDGPVSPADYDEFAPM